jgi:trigger factor
MNFSWEDVEATKKKLMVEVPAEAVRLRLEDRLREVGKTVRFKGFRPGKVPLNMIKRLYGAQVEQEVSEALVNEALPAALKEKDLHLASPPDMEKADFKEGEPFRFTLNLEIKPAFELADYKGLELSRQSVVVTEEMVDERMERIREAHATTCSLDADRAVDLNDIVVLDYQAFIGEEPVAGLANPNYQLEVGRGLFHPAFEAALAGLKKGESKEITVDFEPEHFNKKLAGQTVLFKTRLLDIKEKVLPEMNEEFLKELGEQFKTLGDLRQRVREDLDRLEEQRSQDLLRAQTRDRLLDLAGFEIPAGMVQREVEAMVAHTRFNFTRSGLTLEAAGLSEEKLRADYLEPARKQVKTGLILERIARENEVSVSDEEIRAAVMAMARQTGQSPDQILDMYSKNNMMDRMHEDLLTEKTLNFVLENAKIQITASEPPPADEKTDQPAEK